jgi:hypothetical protein
MKTDPDTVSRSRFTVPTKKVGGRFGEVADKVF